ncbi:uncharacterized protein LOC115987763 isoform X1 [Quercus lobata]|uniref:uncharacterized protein LOC115987763 isoform X1 n=1 Tax=Quercus lobata TaxID=97700 RepID=UPI00124466C0|nr:uncharacterized protein LOC115987763 isoform X1 [Quercus lobata]
MAENPKEMENPEEVKLHSAFLADFGAIHQELMDQEAKTAQAEAAAAEMAETLKLELVLPITYMQEAKALSKLHEEYEFKGSVELLHQGLSMAERRELLEVAKAYMLKLSGKYWSNFHLEFGNGSSFVITLACNTNVQ